MVINDEKQSLHTLITVTELIIALLQMDKKDDLEHLVMEFTKK